MAFSTRAKKAAAAAVAGAERILLTPRKIFGGGQAAGTEPDSEALPQSTGPRARDDVPLQSPAPLARISKAHADGEIMVQTGDEAPLSTEPQARMSSDDKASTSAVMLQLQLMQEEQKKGQQRMDARFDELRDEMKQERNELRNELRSEMQQWRLD